MFQISGGGAGTVVGRACWPLAPVSRHSTIGRLVFLWLLFITTEVCSGIISLGIYRSRKNFWKMGWSSPARIYHRRVFYIICSISYSHRSVGIS